MKQQLEQMRKKVLGQLTDEFLSKLADEILDNNHLQFYLVIGNNGELWRYFSLPVFNDDDSEVNKLQREVIQLPTYYADLSAFDEDELEYIKEGLTYEIKKMVTEAIKRIDDRYWKL